MDFKAALLSNQSIASYSEAQNSRRNLDGEKFCKHCSLVGVFTSERYLITCPVLTKSRSLQGMTDTSVWLNHSLCWWKNWSPHIYALVASAADTAVHKGMKQKLLLPFKNTALTAVTSFPFHVCKETTTLIDRHLCNEDIIVRLFIKCRAPLLRPPPLINWGAEQLLLTHATRWILLASDKINEGFGHLLAVAWRTEEADQKGPAAHHSSTWTKPYSIIICMKGHCQYKETAGSGLQHTV